jgi:hypothetical protein
MTTGDAGSEMEKIGTIIARALAFLCLQQTNAREGTLLEKARFLSGLGLPYADAAGILGTTKASLDELERRAKNAKGKGRGKQTKGKPKAKRGK